MKKFRANSYLRIDQIAGVKPSLKVMAQGPYMGHKRRESVAPDFRGCGKTLTWGASPGLSVRGSGFSNPRERSVIEIEGLKPWCNSVIQGFMAFANAA